MTPEVPSNDAEPPPEPVATDLRPIPPIKTTREPPAAADLTRAKPRRVARPVNQWLRSGISDGSRQKRAAWRCCLNRVLGRLLSGLGVSQATAGSSSLTPLGEI